MADSVNYVAIKWLDSSICASITRRGMIQEAYTNEGLEAAIDVVWSLYDNGKLEDLEDLLFSEINWKYVIPAILSR